MVSIQLAVCLQQAERFPDTVGLVTAVATEARIVVVQGFVYSSTVERWESEEREKRRRDVAWMGHHDDVTFVSRPGGGTKSRDSLTVKRSDW